MAAAPSSGRWNDSALEGAEGSEDGRDGQLDGPWPPAAADADADADADDVKLLRAGAAAAGADGSDSAGAEVAVSRGIPAEFRHNATTITAVYCMLFVALGLMVGSFGPSIEELADTTGVEPTDFSTVFLARGAGYLFGSAMSPRLTTRCSAHTVAAVAAVLMAAATALVPFVQSFAVEHAVYLAQGCGGGTIDTLINTLIGFLHRENVARPMHLLHFSFGVGAFLAPVALAQAFAAEGKDFDLRVGPPYWTIAAVTVPLAIMLTRYPTPPKPDTVEEEASAGATGTHGVSKSPFAVVLCCAVCLGAYVGCEVGYGGWLFEFALLRRIAGEQSAAYLVSVFWGCITIGRLFAAAVSERVSVSRMLFLDLCGSAIALAVLILGSDIPALLWIGTILYGLSMASVFPAVMALPTSVGFVMEGKQTSVLVVGGAAGELLIPLGIGWLFKLSPLWLNWVCAAGTASCMCCYFIVLRVSSRSGHKPVPLMSPPAVTPGAGAGASGGGGVGGHSGGEATAPEMVGVQMVPLGGDGSTGFGQPGGAHPHAHLQETAI